MDIETETLEKSAQGFFTAYGAPGLLGREWTGIFSGIQPEDRFDALVDACGFPRDPGGFLKAVETQIKQGQAQGVPARVCLNTIVLPPLFLYHFLETLEPGQSLVSVNTLEKLESATGYPVPNPGIMQQVLDQYPVRLSSHVIRQSKVSDAVADQYLPFEGELDPNGHIITFDGHFKQGLMEQMYQNRAIFLLDMRCPVYCRFCFRKHKSLRREKCPDQADVKTAVARVKHSKTIKEILITGGEPLLNRKNLDTALAGLMEIDHVKSLRIATRSVAYYPHLFLNHNRELISYLKEKQAVCRQLGKTIELGIHLVHPDEISIQTLDIISDLTSAGIPVYVQTPFLKGLNDTGEVLGRLFTLLRNAGAEIYYIFTPCHPIHGTQKYWSPISLSIAAHSHMRANLSDRAIPKLCTATPLGKMEWGTSGWAVEPDESDPDHIWIRTPYTRDYFDQLTGTDSLPLESRLDFRENKDNSLDVKCLIDMGDKDLFLGSHDLTPGESLKTMQNQSVKEIQSWFLKPQSLMDSLVGTNIEGIRRTHKTRVELDLEPDTLCLDYLGSHPEITDIILRVMDSGSVDDQIDWIAKVIDALESLDLCVRLQWQAFHENPDQFTQTHVDRVRSLARLSFVNPLRIEIETWWLGPREITRDHCELAQAFSSQGIPVYGNLALISGVNVNPTLVAQMAHTLRECTIDFHHVYVAGLSVQNEFNQSQPISADQVLAIASHVRKVCSGREIPLYVIWTPLGEVDFGLTASLSSLGEQVVLEAHPYDREYLGGLHGDISMDDILEQYRDQVWETRDRPSGKPCLAMPVIGLEGSGSFPR